MASVADLIGAAEEADTEYTNAVHAASQARANYELAYYKSLANCPIKSVAGRKEHAEAEANDEHREWLLADASERATRQHVNVVLGLLVAAQSQQKFAGKQDGGGSWENF